MEPVCFSSFGELSTFALFNPSLILTKDKHCEFLIFSTGPVLLTHSQCAYLTRVLFLRECFERGTIWQYQTDIPGQDNWSDRPMFFLTWHQSLAKSPKGSSLEWRAAPRSLKDPKLPMMMACCKIIKWRPIVFENRSNRIVFCT